MGYACPVCATPQADDEHLANHLAFTALLGDDDHEAWLDEHVPGWEERGPEELAPDVTEYAEETEYDEVFEDTTGGQSTASAGDNDGHDHGGESFEDRMARELGGDDGRDHEHDERGQGHRQSPAGRGGESDAVDGGGTGQLDDEAQRILEEAHEMTEEMYGDDGAGDAETEGESE